MTTITEPPICVQNTTPSNTGADLPKSTMIAKRPIKILNPNERILQSTTSPSSSSFSSEQPLAVHNSLANHSATSNSNAGNPKPLNSRDSINQHKRLALSLKQQMMLPKFTQQMPLKQVYLEFMLDGRKTVEGRINTGIPARVRVNDHMLFFANDTCCLVKITDKRSFPTFRQMLQHSGIKTCLPDFNGNLDAAERLYRSFPGYAEKEAKFGVLGLTVELVSNVEMESILKRKSDDVVVKVAGTDDQSSGKRKRDNDETQQPEDKVCDQQRDSISNRSSPSTFSSSHETNKRKSTSSHDDRDDDREVRRRESYDNRERPRECNSRYEESRYSVSHGKRSRYEDEYYRNDRYRSY